MPGVPICSGAEDYPLPDSKHFGVGNPNNCRSRRCVCRDGYRRANVLPKVDSVTVDVVDPEALVAHRRVVTIIGGGDAIIKYGNPLTSGKVSGASKHERVGVLRSSVGCGGGHTVLALGDEVRISFVIDPQSVVVGVGALELAHRVSAHMVGSSTSDMEPAIHPDGTSSARGVLEDSVDVRVLEAIRPDRRRGINGDSVVDVDLEPVGVQWDHTTYPSCRGAKVTRLGGLNICHTTPLLHDSPLAARRHSESAAPA